jgi:hypothetical protein
LLVLGGQLRLLAPGFRLHLPGVSNGLCVLEPLLDVLLSR